MRLIVAEDEFPAELRGGVVAIGNFDGVHRGHQSLLKQAEAEARRRGAPWGLVTFEPHPRSFFRPSEPVFRLTPLPLKARLVAALGAHFVAVLDFDARLAAMDPTDFVRLHLHERMDIRHAVTGYDFHFGKGRKGTAETMRALGEAYGFGVTAVDQVTDDDGLAPFSSSAIRDALRHGHLEQASHQLGYDWTVMGTVVHGDSRGRTLGFPTLNIKLEAGAEPYRGIYAVWVRDVNSGERWQGAGYIGDRPTFGTQRIFLEVFLFDFDGDLYDRTLAVQFVGLIRPDRSFATAEALRDQMADDCAKAKLILRHPSPAARYPLGGMQHEGKL
jgi:riboflavin kinase/FMN adenylyltransferase